MTVNLPVNRRYLAASSIQERDGLSVHTTAAPRMTAGMPRYVDGVVDMVFAKESVSPDVKSVLCRTIPRLRSSEGN